jgi:phenylalanyl-tRNA synthetase beta chain
MKIINYKNIVATQLNSQGFNEIMANSLTTASYIELSAKKNTM